MTTAKNRKCKECGRTQPIEKFERVRNSYRYANAGWSRKRTCNRCLYLQKKARREQAS